MLFSGKGHAVLLLKSVGVSRVEQETLTGRASSGYDDLSCGKSARWSVVLDLGIGYGSQGVVSSDRAEGQQFLPLSEEADFGSCLVVDLNKVLPSYKGSHADWELHYHGPFVILAFVRVKFKILIAHFSFLLDLL